MQAKLKKCEECQEDKLIWKRHEGKKYCKDCYYKLNLKNKPLKKPNKPLSKKSSKQAKLDAAYLVLRETFLKNNSFCKAKLHGCTINATDIHHKAGRGIYMLDSTLFLPVCRICHGQIETNPIMAKELGLSISREEIRKNNENNKIQR